jgi:hypothetical protein
MRACVKLCETNIPLAKSIRSMGEYRSKWLIAFRRIGIVNCRDDNYCIVYHSGLLENGGCKSELERWKSPEILKKEERRKSGRDSSLFGGIHNIIVIPG